MRQAGRAQWWILLVVALLIVAAWPSDQDRTAPGTGVSNATLQFTAPATTGTYNVRLFSNNTFTRLATSGPVTVR